MKIGIYGGSFDPVHFGHLLLAEAALVECELDRMIFVPNRIGPHKTDHPPESGEHRIEMINAAIAGYEQYSASRFEIDSTGSVNYTVDTLRHFSRSLLDAELFLVLGADMFNDLPHWKEVSEICRLAIPVVASRPGFSQPYYEGLSHFVPQKRLEMFHSFHIVMPQMELSSSKIRSNIREGKSIRFQTPRVVESYIHTHRLYR